MREVAILSKNILIESDLEQKLQRLGYEVFCSTRMLDQLLLQQGVQYLTTFKTIIISETVSDEEVTTLIGNIGKSLRVYRVDSEMPSNQELEAWQNRHPISWLAKESSLKELREKLSEDQPYEKDTPQETEESPEKKEEAYLLFMDCLSKNERELFNKLYDAEGQAIARSALCHQLWNECTSSNMAQLSQLIRRLREKMKDYELNNKALQTHWKNGYSLSKKILMGQSHEGNS